MGILSAFRFAFQNLFFSPILYGVIASLAVFSSVWESGDRLKDKLTDGHRSQDDSFDFIIVGAGSAGAVLANRLSQYHTVLLLEAGGETHPFQAIPGLSIFIPKHTGTDWMHKSVTQTKSCLSCHHKKYILSQGKNLGGTGNLNYMIHHRGNPLDFDNWATITGDPTWSYEGVLPYFIQSEHFVGDSTDKAAHGYGGPLQIQIPDCIGLAEEWNHAGEEMGYPHVDLNGRHSEGFDTVFYPIKHGVRQATYRSYIQPVRNRLSLLIRKFAHVNKVLIRDGTNEAYGVEYDRHGHRKIAFANKEVILSAGTLQTPKLLILSGVGQLEHLNALHIPARSVLPVGKNLQDHFSTLLGPFYINKPRTISFDRDIDKRSFLTFATTGKGPLSTTGFMATAVVTSALAKASGQDGWPDIQLTLFGLTPHRMFYSDIGHAFGIRQDVLHKYYGDAEGKENAFFIMVTLARPLSKGDFCVPTKNPYKPAVIDPNYLMDGVGHDANVMIEGIHRALYLAENTTAFAALETFYTQKCFPGCEGFPFRSDDYWQCYIRHFSIANNDHVGTCPLGKAGSPYAVVDPELQVQGIKGLRVVDASVMPTIVGAPTQAATIMIGEKASTLILDKWKQTAKEFYGVPGVKPGEPVGQYGPPITNVGPQYGPPGIKPAPITGGDGFENYDSFSVIKDQLNPNSNGAVGPTTALIPIVPGTGVWSTPAPFPSSPSAAPIPPYIHSGISAASPQPAILTPEPSVVLVPPETLNSGNLPSSSYPTDNLEFNNGLPIVSSTPSYPVSYHLDTSRSEKALVTSELGTTESNANNNTGARQGKSFAIGSSTILPEGNQLGEGFIEKVTPLYSPSSSPVYLPSPSSTVSTPFDGIVETEVVTQGPDFRVVRRRFKTTPRVVVHPRGHLGHQNVPRMNKALNESLESLFLTTSSSRPVPKEIVKIKRRRPVPNKRRTTTSPAPPTSHPSLQDESLVTSAYSNTGAEFATTPRPPVKTTELPTELKSPGRKRFVRKMYARPINFNGKRFDVGRTRNDFVAASSVSPITVIYDKLFIARSTTPDPNRQQAIQERIDLDTAATTSVEAEIPSTSESLVRVDLDDPIFSIANDTITEATEAANSTLDDSVTSQPVIVFKNIELENVEERSRQTRRVNKSDYFQYNLLTEESRNPIMLVDLNPIPEIIAPKSQTDSTVKDNSQEHETLAIALKKGDVEDEVGKEEDETSTEESNEEVFGDYSDDVTEEPKSEVSFGEDNKNNTDTPDFEIVNDENENLPSLPNLYDDNGDTDNQNYSLEDVDLQFKSNSSDFRSGSNSSAEDFPSSYESYEDTLLQVGKNESSISDNSSQVNVNNTKSVSSQKIDESTSTSTTVHPRYMFRARNKLLRVHS